MSSINNDAIGWHSQVAELFDANYAENKVFKQRFRIWQKLIDHYSTSKTILLDAGCGSGVISFYASTKCSQVVAIDASTEMIRICNEKSQKNNIDNITFKVENLEKLNEKYRSSFDAVLSSSVLEYLSDFDNVLKKLCSCLKPGGILIISLPNKDSIYRKLLPLIYKITKRPTYFKYIKNILSMDMAVAKLKCNKFEFIEGGYYSKTPILSNIFCKTEKYKKYSENLFFIVAKKINQA